MLPEQPVGATTTGGAGIGAGVIGTGAGITTGAGAIVPVQLP
jgi:hypothetical protein